MMQVLWLNVMDVAVKPRMTWALDSAPPCLKCAVIVSGIWWSFVASCSSCSTLLNIPCMSCAVVNRDFPHVETFVKERISNYPNLQVKYQFGSPPRLTLRSGTKSETIRIDHWKTEHIEEYLKDKLLSPQLSYN